MSARRDDYKSLSSLTNVVAEYAKKHINQVVIYEICSCKDSGAVRILEQYDNLK